MLRYILFICFTILILAGCGQEQLEQGNEEETPNQNAQEVSANTAMETSVEINQQDQTVLFDIKIKNIGEKDYTVTFPSGQYFEIIVKDEDNEEVYKYSEGKMFTQAVETKEIKAGEQLSLHDEWAVNEGIKSGTYTAIVNVRASKINGQDILEDALLTKEKFELNTGNTAFRNITVTGENGEYSVKGEARVFEGTFMYSVEDGHEYLIEEKVIQLNSGAPNWTPFEIEIALKEDQLPRSGTVTLNLYERSAKDNAMDNMYYVELETFE